jgi:hypothetical protein
VALFRFVWRVVSFPCLSCCTQNGNGNRNGNQNERRQGTKRKRNLNGRPKAGRKRKAKAARGKPKGKGSRKERDFCPPFVFLPSFHYSRFPSFPVPVRAKGKNIFVTKKPFPCSFRRFYLCSYKLEKINL